VGSRLTPSPLFVCNAAEAVLLGFQHYLVMLGTTVIIPTALVPQMGGGNVRSSPTLSSLSLYECVCARPPPVPAA
jgi:xanthine/uracil permease